MQNAFNIMKVTYGGSSWHAVGVSADISEMNIQKKPG